MRLAAALAPSFPADLVTRLEKCGIKTDADLLFSTTILDTFQRLPPGTSSLHELTDYAALVAKVASATGIRAIDALPPLTDVNQGIDDFLSGVSELDELLDGFSRSRIIEISGDRGSGKTTFVHHIMLRHLVNHPESGALWIDTTGEFSGERMAQILESCDGQAASTALDRLQVSLAFDIETAHETLESLHIALSSNSPPDTRIRCIVLDSITPLLGPLLSAASSQGHAIMTGFMRQLRELALNFSLTIFVINSTTACNPRNRMSAFATPSRKPALGPSFPFFSDATLWLSQTSHTKSPTDGALNDDSIISTVHIAEVSRSKTSRSKSLCTFKIRQGVLLGNSSSTDVDRPIPSADN